MTPIKASTGLTDTIAHARGKRVAVRYSNRRVSMALLATLRQRVGMTQAQFAAGGS